uniref:DUF6589 domain-containing protein n=1 Tax=Amphimedon queenslandica TaxID=400682 RepID=A0A1X7UBB4_AMPQE
SSGVLRKNKMKNEDMVAILSFLQQYVPVRLENVELVDPNDGQVFQLSADCFHYVLFGGDQLTAERDTGAKRSKDNENQGIDRLKGLVPETEDWHAKVCFLKAHILHRVMKKLGLNTLDETPSSDSTFGDIFLNSSDAKREDAFMNFVSDIVNEYTHGFETNQLQNVKEQDPVLAYA